LGVGTVLQTDSGRQVEKTTVIERAIQKELGKKAVVPSEEGLPSYRKI